MKNEYVIIFVFALSMFLNSRVTPMNYKFIGVELQKDSVVLENPYLTAVHNRSLFNKSNTENIGTRIIVALSDATIKSSKKDYHLQRGNIAVFLSNESYEPPTGEYFEIALKKDHPPYKGPEQWLEPQKNIIVYEDEQFRVFEERLAPHDLRELHSHSQRLVVRLNLVQLTDPRFLETAKPGSGIQVPNTVKFAEPIIHEVKNLSDIPLFNIVIEFKPQHN